MQQHPTESQKWPAPEDKEEDIIGLDDIEYEELSDTSEDEISNATNDSEWFDDTEEEGNFILYAIETATEEQIKRINEALNSFSVDKQVKCNIPLDHQKK